MTMREEVMVIVRDSEGERRWKINLQESQYIYRHKYDTQNYDICLTVQ